jgi:hypothetical protein
MERMGDKINSKKVAHKVGVQTIPGVEKGNKKVLKKQKKLLIQ